MHGVSAGADEQHPVSVGRYTCICMSVMMKQTPKRFSYQHLDSGMQGMVFSLYLFPVHSCVPPCGVRGFAFSCGDTCRTKSRGNLGFLSCSNHKDPVNIT